MVSKIQEIKTETVAETNKFVTAVKAFIGSRILLALLAMCVVAFGVQSLYAPDRLPPIAGLDLIRQFMPQVDSGVIGAKLQEAQDAAVRQGGLDRLNDFIAAHQAQIPLYNLIGLGLSALLLVWNILVAAAKWKGSTGIVIGAP